VQPSTYTFRVPDEPVPKVRPRVTSRGTYTPPEVVAAEMKTAMYFREKYPGHQVDPDGEYRVRLAYFTRRWAKDLDNLIKLSLDSLNGVVWKDDRQVSQIEARKLRATKQDPEVGTIIIIEELPCQKTPKTKKSSQSVKRTKTSSSPPPKS
jgi:Holliday junction resolvase RusA-like endonuclease